MSLKSTFHCLLKRGSYLPNSKFSTHNLILFSKKKLSLKNVFTFQNNFQEQDLPDPSVKGRIISSDLLSNPHTVPKQIKRSYEDRSSSKFSQNKKKQIFTSLTYKGEIVFGIHPVYLALLQQRRSLHQLYVRKETNLIPDDAMKRKKEIISLAESLNIPISVVESKSLKILAPDSVHQGVCLDAGFLPVPCWKQDDTDHHKLEKTPLWLVLDEILDPMNVGAIIRSAHYFGVDKIFTVKGNSCKLSPTVSKASSGALEVVDLYQLENLEDFIKDRKSKCWSILSTMAYSENPLESEKLQMNATEFSLSKPTILVLGNEGKGVSKSIQNLCDTFITIEPGQSLYKGVDSLNVSVATGVLLYALTSKTWKR